MAIEFDYTLADMTFYEPVSAADPGQRYRPGPMPAAWREVESGIWTNWYAPGLTTMPEAGWKVHVSSARATAAEVLGLVAGIAVEQRIAFKHLTGVRFFALMHGKHASRAQSGKFCALYPPTEEQALALMTALTEALRGHSGSYVLSDRRFADSRCVHYRYGAFRPHQSLQVDGTRSYVRRTADGTLVPDDRKPEFRLPEGIADPFEALAPAEAEPESDELVFGGYTFEGLLRHSNGGGAYRGRAADGREVFLKEARAHNGYTVDADGQHRLRSEYEVLVDLHRRAPGLAPEPVDYFRHWEHEFLVTEFLPGRSLRKWMTSNNPRLWSDATPADNADYYERCQQVLERIEQALGRLHELGYAFVDVAPDNVLIDEDDRIRFIDFEATQRSDEPLRMLFTPGYVQPQVLMSAAVRADTPPLDVDAYGLSALALLLVFPMHPVFEYSAESLTHLGADLADEAPVPEPLWRRVTHNHPVSCRQLPDPEEVRRDPVGVLRSLRERSLTALTALARPDGERWVFPTTPQGLRTNTRCVAHGTAGVLHALHYAGVRPEQQLITRLRDDSLQAKDDTPPGLLIGNAGIAWVLDELGESAAAAELLDAATGSALLPRSGTLGNGLAGVGLAHLAAYTRSGDDSHLRTATRLLEAIPPDPTPVLGPDNSSGLVLGRPGLALAMYYLARFTGEDRWLDRGEQLLRDELAHRVPLGSDSVGFTASDTDRRKMPYLYSGSAGYAHVLARYLQVRPDPQWQDVLDGCLRAMRVRFTVFAGLLQGQAGMALVAGEVADLQGRADLLAQEMAAGTALVKYAVAHSSGIRWLGDQGQRFSADLWSGSAGIVVALHRMLHGTRDPLFTLDRALVTPPRLPRTNLDPIATAEGLIT